MCFPSTCNLYAKLIVCSLKPYTFHLLNQKKKKRLKYSFHNQIKMLCTQLGDVMLPVNMMSPNCNIVKFPPLNSKTIRRIREIKINCIHPHHPKMRSKHLCERSMGMSGL